MSTSSSPISPPCRVPVTEVAQLLEVRAKGLPHIQRTEDLLTDGGELLLHGLPLLLELPEPQLCQRNCHAPRRQLGHGPLQAANFIPFGLFLCVSPPGLEPEDHQHRQGPAPGLLELVPMECQGQPAGVLNLLAVDDKSPIPAPPQYLTIRHSCQ